MIRIQNAGKSFGTKKIFENLNLEISQPGFYVLWGKSGCGKSTLLNMIASLDSFDCGEIEIDAEVMTIFQSYELIDELNVYDNIFLTRKMKESDRDLIDKLGLMPLLKQYPKELSGGQKQRAGIARALLRRPVIICCDEPTESLDIENQKIVLSILKEYSRNHIVLMATHQKNVISEYADHVLAFQNCHLVQMDREGLEKNALAEEKKHRPSRKKIQQLIHHIIHRKNLLITGMCMICMILAQASVLLRQHLFTIPTTLNVVNANVLYVETDDASQLSNAEKIPSFSNLQYNNQEFLTNIYPYEANSLKLEGNVPKGTDVVINQVLARKVFDDNALDHTITLTYTVAPYTYSIDARITGIIEESDTEQMNIYYDLDGIISTFSDIALQDGMPLRDYFDSHCNTYKLKVPYSEIDSFQSSHPQMTVHNPLHDERKEMEESSRIYQYMFAGFTVIITGLLSVLIFSVTEKQTEKLQKTFVILSSTGISMKYLIQQYIKEKMVLLVLISLLDLTALTVVYLTMPHLSVVIPVCIAAGINILQWIALRLSTAKINKTKYADILKEES